MAENRKPYIIAVAGGIGSGKSVVCRILTTMGYEVYDCDRKAKMIMDSNPDVRESITALFGPGYVENGAINRKRLSNLVFGDGDALAALNSLVHGLVRTDFDAWVNTKPCVSPVFVETAILYQSGFDRLVDEVWTVVAPERVRIERVMKRNNLSEHQVKARIEAQDSYSITDPHHNEKEIINDGVLPLLPRIEKLLNQLP